MRPDRAATGLENAMAAADTERFRLRRFVERLVQAGECEVHDKPIDLVDVARCSTAIRARPGSRRWGRRRPS